MKDNYTKAKLAIQKIKKKFDYFELSFPDITPNKIVLIKDKWEKLPSEISRGIKIMGLDSKGTFKSLIISYDPDGYIMPHKHEKRYELGLILKGELIDKLNGKIYRTGDTYKFYPNEIHYLVSSINGCIVYSSLTTDKDYILKPLLKKQSKKIIN